MDLRTPHRFFSSRLYSITRSLYFQGQLMAQPLTENTGYFLLARRMLKLDAESPVIGGEIIRTTAGKTYITEAHATSELQDQSIYKTLRMYETTDFVNAMIPQTAKDSILGRPTETNPNLVLWEKIYCAIEPQALEHDALKNLTSVYRIITNRPVPLGAILGGIYRVTNSEYRGGCYFLVAQRL